MYTTTLYPCPCLHAKVPLVKKPSSLADAVYATVAWFDVFDQPILAEEVHRFLFYRRALLAEVKLALYSHPRIQHSLGLFYLRGRGSLVMQRYQRQLRTQQLWERALQFRWLLRLIPFCRLIAVGNSLAFGWPSRESDIDLFVVTTNTRLFTARSFLSIFTHLLRVRRHGDRVAQRFCLSFFTAESHQNLQPIALTAHDPYLAFWIASIHPIMGSAADFLRHNDWVHTYFPNFTHHPLQLVYTPPSRFARVLEILSANPLGNLIEYVLKHWQLRRAEKKRKNQHETAVIIAPHMLKFHETDKRVQLLAAWEERLQKGMRVTKKNTDTKVIKSASAQKKATDTKKRVVKKAGGTKKVVQRK